MDCCALEGHQSLCGEYHEAQRDIDKRAGQDKICLLATHGFNALAATYIQTEDGELKEAMVNVAKRWAEVAKQQNVLPWKYLHRYAPRCRVSNMCDASAKRLEIAVPSMLQAMEAEERGKSYSCLELRIRTISLNMFKKDESIKPNIWLA